MTNNHVIFHQYLQFKNFNIVLIFLIDDYRVKKLYTLQKYYRF